MFSYQGVAPSTSSPSSFRGLCALLKETLKNNVGFDVEHSNEFFLSVGAVV